MIYYLHSVQRGKKKQLEILLMDYFRANYPDFPKGRVVADESPDFWVRMKNRNTLGIEMTRLNPVNADPPGDDKKQLIYFREEMIQQAKSIYHYSSDIPLFVKILFSEKETISEERSMSVAVRLAGLIRIVAEGEKSESFYSKHLGKEQLPLGMDEVIIIRHPGLKTSIWERSNNLGVSNNVIDDIHKAIQKKDEKLRLYHKNHLNLYWLLITTDRLRSVKSVNLVNKIMNHNFESRFQHVFLFDLLKAKVFELV